MSAQPAIPVHKSKALLLRSLDGRIRPIWRLLLFLVAGFVVLLGAQALAGLWTKLFPQRSGTIVAIVLQDVGLVLLSWLFLRLLDRRPYGALGLWFYPGWWREALIGLGSGALLLGAIVGALVASGLVQYQGWAASWSVAPSLAGSAAFFLAAATLEELIFRGYAFQRLLDSAGELWAILLLSALFGAAHLNNPDATALSTANTVLAGIWLAIAYLKTRALWLPIALHWVWNFLLGPVFSLPVSGIRCEPVLFQTDVKGPAWMSGTGYGPEGSLIATVGLTAMVIWLAFTKRIRPCDQMTAAMGKSC